MVNHRITSINLFAIVGLLLSNFHQCTAQETSDRYDLILPNPDLYIEGGNDTNGTSFRTNFCHLQQRMDDGQVDLRNALMGQVLNTRVTYDLNYVNALPEDQTDDNGDRLIDPDNPGILINILDEVARRAGFSWRDSWHWMKPPSGDTTWTELLVMSTDAYDISAEWWYSTVERITLGVSFPSGWYDGDLIIIQRDPEETSFGGSVFRPFSWSQPFTLGVWMWLAFTLIVSGFVALLLEDRSNGDPLSDAPIKGNKVSLFIFYIQKSFSTFTGEYDLFTKSHAGFIFSFSLAFFSLLMISAYTANLASFLVIQQSSMEPRVNTVNDIVRLGRSICVQGNGSAVVESLNRVHPDAVLIEKDDNKKVLEGLRDQECNYALLSVAAWEEYKGISEINSDCNLSRVGRVFEQLEAGFATASDAGTFCTSLVRDVLNLHFEEMIRDGFIADQWETTMEKRHDITDPTCLNEDTTVIPEDTNILTMQSLGGIFLLHFFFIVISLAVAGWNRWYEKRMAFILPRNVVNTSMSSEENLSSSQKVLSHTNPIEIHTNTSTNNKAEIEVLSERIDHLSTTMNEIMTILKDCNIERIPLGGDPPQR